MPRTTPQPLLALAAALLSVASAQTPSAGVPSDVKHIRCETCESLVSAAHRRFAELRKGSKKALSEEDAMSVVETVCDPEADGGAWLRSLDLQEQGRRLRLVKQAEDGPCGVECATLRLACQALMEEGWENELGEALYGAVDADELAESACREWSSACRKPAPKLDPARPAGPPFRAYTQEERAARLGGPPPAGLLTAAALAGRLGLPPPPASEADPALDGLDGFDDGGGETSGRGSALFSLDRSEAFRPVAGCLPPWCALVVGAVGGAVGGDAAAARGHVSVSGAAPWHDDQAVEAAALLYASHGGAGVLRFWRAWAAAPRCASRPAAPCVMSVLRRIELPPLELAALSAALAARTEAPMVEAWAQHAAAAMGRDEGRGAVVAAACNETHASIRAAVAAATTGACAGDAAEVVDHALPSAGEGAGSPRLVAYVDPHSPGLAKAIERLLEAAAGRCAVSLRYLPAAGSGTVPLFGFGIDVALRSTEYRVVDDDKETAADGDAEEADKEEAADAAAGDAAPSWMLRHRASEPLVGSALPPSRIAGLGVAAAVAVLKSRRPLAALRDVSGALPTLARHLSRLSLKSPANAPLVEALAARWPLLNSARGALLLNGLPLDLEREDAAHAAVRQALAEATAAAELIGLGLAPRAASRLLAMAPPRPPRVDVREMEARVEVLWLSDVETDAPFAEWPTDLASATRGYGGASQFTRHNLLTAVFVVDPASRAGARLAGYAAELCRKAAPVRVGVLLRSGTSSGTSAPRAGLGVRLARHAFEAGGRGALLALLRSLDASAALGAAEGGHLPDGALREALAAALEQKSHKPKGKKRKRAAKGADAGRGVEEAFERLAGGDTQQDESPAFGLPDEPLVLVNGLVLRGDGSGLREAVGHELKLEATQLRGAVEAGALSADAGDVPRAVLSLWAGRGELLDEYSEGAVNRSSELRIGRILAEARAEEGRGDAEAEVDASVLAAAHAVLSRRVWREARARPRLGMTAKVGACGPGCLELPGEGAGAALHLVAVVEPLSVRANLVASLLIALRQALQARCTLLLATAPLREEPLPAPRDALPLAEFHSRAIGPLDALQPPPTALLEIVRSAQTLTLSVVAPSGWSVRLGVASDDLDNLQLDQLPPGHTVTASVSLASLLVSGRCASERRKGRKGKKGRGGGEASCAGEELRLSRAGAPAGAEAEAETRVMGGSVGAGYFQLPARPGLWRLAGSNVGDKDVALLSWTGGRVAVRPTASQPRDAEASARGGRGGGGRVHVFSLASGALYERFLRIMMRTAAERCSRPVTFHLLETFLTPEMRDAVHSGALARAVSAGLDAARAAEIRLVDYRWPAHLRHQREKQRLIWGHKILFLDLLFPLDVQRVIYIDADQIVQGDVAALYDMDLSGRPVAMTPFCRADPNADTTGYRFWESGFWASHLEPRPYHISALFVVDLAAFRQLGVGDTYRDSYQSLTADPSSLANLDQDLPNYLQRAVPIYSLPEEWLWCETWCGNASKPRAKTIDLCNNPLTKEPKLEQARRIGGERWRRVDEELQAALAGGSASRAKEEL